MVDVSPAQFDVLVSEALDGLPPGLSQLIDNVVVLVDDEPPPDRPGLLGQYVGVPLTARDTHYAGVLPDRIMVYRGPLQRICRTPEELVDEVTVTIVHEIAHYFGIGEQRLHELGWG